MSHRFPEEGFVRLPQILTIIPVSASTWWRGVKAGRYPSPVRLTERTTAWRVEDIRALIDSLSSKISFNDEKTSS